MSRNRIIYQGLALFAGQSGVSGVHTGAAIKQFTRVQNWDADFSRSFQDVNQFGQLAARDRIEVEAPTVNMSTSWYLTDGSNEKYAGLTVYRGAGETSALSGILKKTSDEHNFFLLVAKEGSDAVGYAGTGAGATGVVGIGNAFLTNYSLEASVGAIPTASADFEALNYRIYADADGSDDVPAINPTNGLPVTGVAFLLPTAAQDDSVGQPSVLRPGDVTVELTSNAVTGFAASGLKIQSFNLGIPLSRSPIEKLGSRFPYTREPDFPITATLSVNAIAGDLSDANLADIICQTGTFDISVTMKGNDCSGNGTPAMIVKFKGAKLVSESFSTSIGDNASVDFNYEVQLSGPEDLARGVFLSGSYA